MDDTNLSTLSGALSAAKLARAAQDKQQRARAEAVAVAWRAVREGGGDTEIAALQSLQGDAPDPATADELERLHAARTKAIEAVRRRADTEAAMAAATAARARGDLLAALGAAERAQELSPDHAAAAELAAALRAQLREQAARDARLARAAAHIETARADLARGRFERALREAARAAELDPAHDAPAAITRDALAGRAAAEVARAREAAEAQRRRAAAPSLAAARLALREGHIARARWAAENALAIDPGCEEALGILAGTAGVDPMVREETVDMSAADPDDTATLRVESRFAGAGQYVRRLVGTLRGAMTRRRSTHAGDRF
jgi:tetratricopeptide (TPR) repeat protein